MTNGILVAPEQELVQRFERRARGGRLYSRLEIISRGFMLGAQTVLAKMGRDECGRPCLALDDEPRVQALLAAALGRARAVDTGAYRSFARSCYGDP